jgi:2,3-bisphosphoglycerate-independent phosphoglycerate mutase
MKYAVVLPDGAADVAMAELDGRTPLESAQTPYMDWIARHGRQGCVLTVPDGFISGTDVATLSLLGYDPKASYSGQASFEATARGLTIAEDQLVFRCNFVTVEDGLMQDYTADHITQPEADELIADLNALFADEPFEFHAGGSYRNLMVASNASHMRPTCQAPHDISNQPVADYMPAGSGSDQIRSVMARASMLLARHPVNAARMQAGRRPVTHIWLWGQGGPTLLESFAERFGYLGAVIAGADIIRGLAACAGMRLIDVPGATGGLDTDYAGKGRAALEALEDFDLVLVHIAAPDVAGHRGDAPAKVEALERIDDLIVGPLLQALRQCPAWRILVAPDHATLLTTRAHSRVPPPFCCAGRHIEPLEKEPFCEAHAGHSGLYIRPGHDLMGLFMRGRFD